MSRQLCIRATVAALFVAASACAKSDGDLSDSAAGAISEDSALIGVEFRGVKVPLTSDNFKKFLVAQERLDSIPNPPDVPRIDVRNPTDDAIELAVDRLEDHEDAKRAIEESGISVKDFVLTSLALGQALAFSTDPRIPPTNVAFIDSNRAEINRLELRRRFRIVDRDRVRLRGDDDDTDDDTDADSDDDTDDDDRGRRARGHRGGDDDRPGRGNRGRGRGGRG